MHKFATITPVYRLKKVTYYSIHFEGEEDSLFARFVDEHSDEAFYEQLSLIRSWLRKLGDEIGADERYFRHEAFRGGDARALPPPARYIDLDCPLRLYCMRMNAGAVILFGGAEKTAATAQECENVRPHFLLANRLTKAIDQALRAGDISIDPQTGELLFDDDLTLTL